MRTEDNKKKKGRKGRATGWAKAGSAGGGKRAELAERARGLGGGVRFFVHPNGTAFGMISLCIFKMDVCYRYVAFFAQVVIEVDCLLNRNT